MSGMRLSAMLAAVLVLGVAALPVRAQNNDDAAFDAAANAEQSFDVAASVPAADTGVSGDADVFPTTSGDPADPPAPVLEVAGPPASGDVPVLTPDGGPKDTPPVEGEKSPEGVGDAPVDGDNLKSKPGEDDTKEKITGLREGHKAHPQNDTAAYWTQALNPSADSAKVDAVVDKVNAAGTTEEKLTALREEVRAQLKDDPSNVCRHHAILLKAAADKLGYDNTFISSGWTPKAHCYNQVTVDGKKYIVDGFWEVHYPAE